MRVIADNLPQKCNGYFLKKIFKVFETLQNEITQKIF